jgi:DNA-directed RNA polymerase specialized sigma24 family protein
VDLFHLKLSNLASLTQPKKGGIKDGRLARGGEASDRRNYKIMFGEITEYSSDVEWLLQNKQADVTTILNALVPEHFEQTKHLAYLLSRDAMIAQQLSFETFAKALLTRDRYSSDQEVQEWLNQILINCDPDYLATRKFSDNGGKKTWQAENASGWKNDDENEQQLYRILDSLPVSDQLPFLLNAILAYPVDWIARMLRLKEEIVAARIEGTQDILLSRFYGEGNSQPHLDKEKMNLYLSQSFLKRLEAEGTVPGRFDDPVAAIQELVEEKKRDRRRKMILQEVVLVAIVIVLVITLVQAAVVLSDDPNASEVLPTLRGYFSSLGIPGWY